MAETQNMLDMQILELDSFEVPFPMSPEEQERYSRRFLTLFVSPDDQPKRGGSGCVFKVMNAQGETFAMKRIEKPPRSAIADDERYERSVTAQVAAFRKEFENQQRLSGLKGFPKLYGYGMESGEPLIIMEWVEGTTCSKAVDLRSADPTGKRAAPLIVARLGIVLFDLISRFNYLDDSFAHRDISPNNIMLRTDGKSVAEQVATDEYDICLIDFGSATLLTPHEDPSFTTMMSVLRKATPEYAPPEMLTNDLPDLERLRKSALIDVYAIASVLYELMCGQTPYRLGELSCDPESYYRFKIDHTIPEPLSLHMEPKALGTLSAQPRLMQVAKRIKASGQLDEMRFVESVGYVDRQLGQILLRALRPRQQKRAQAWEMKDMLTKFVDDYAANIERRYRGQSVTSQLPSAKLPAQTVAPVPLAAQSIPPQVTILRPVVPLSSPLAPRQTQFPAGKTGAKARVRAHGDLGGHIVAAIITGLVVIALSVATAVILAGSPATLSLFGFTFTGEVPFLIFLLGVLAPPLVALPFFWAGSTSGSRMLGGTVALVVIETLTWTVVHITAWVSPSVEPFASMVIVAVVCIIVIVSWRLTVNRGAS